MRHSVNNPPKRRANICKKTVHEETEDHRKRFCETYAGRYRRQASREHE